MNICLHLNLFLYFSLSLPVQQITKEDGYILGNELTSWSRQAQYVIIPKLHMEAALKLSLLEVITESVCDAHTMKKVEMSRYYMHFT